MTSGMRRMLEKKKKNSPVAFLVFRSLCCVFYFFFVWSQWKNKVHVQGHIGKELSCLRICSEYFDSIGFMSPCLRLIRKTKMWVCGLKLPQWCPKATTVFALFSFEPGKAGKRHFTTRPSVLFHSISNCSICKLQSKHLSNHYRKNKRKSQRLPVLGESQLYKETSATYQPRFKG